MAPSNPSKPLPSLKTAKQIVPESLDEKGGQFGGTVVAKVSWRALNCQEKEERLEQGIKNPESWDPVGR